jgi:pre-mRNA-processing factor 19
VILGHPPFNINSDDFLVSVSKDSSWCFNDITRGVCLSQTKLDPDIGGFLCSQFHPDGLILATGTERGVVKLWDIRERQNVANCEEHQGAILSLSFNENGYLLASGGADGLAHIWDLRKIKSLSSISSKCTRL